MFEGIKRLLSGTSNTQEGIIPPEQITTMPQGSYEVYARPLREPTDGERIDDVTTEFVYMHPGHRPQGRGWKGKTDR
jgi:hypothetical protein